MRTITLGKPWTYRTPAKTVEYPAGEHEVTNEVAQQAIAEGIIPEETAGGTSDKSAKAGKASAADAS